MLRHLVMDDAGVAEFRPSLRSRLRGFLARADPDSADLLQVFEVDDFYDELFRTLQLQ